MAKLFIIILKVKCTFFEKELKVFFFLSKRPILLWVPINSADKVSDGYIRDLEFNPRLQQKLIGVLV